MGCKHSRVAPWPTPENVRPKETRFSRLKRWFLKLPEKWNPVDKTTILVAIDHSGKLSGKLEKKKAGFRRPKINPSSIQAKDLKRTAFGLVRKEPLPAIEKEEEVEVTVVWTRRESKFVLDPLHVRRADGFRVIEKTFKVAKSDKQARNIVHGLKIGKEKEGN